MSKEDLVGLCQAGCEKFRPLLRLCTGLKYTEKGNQVWGSRLVNVT